jgi:hypothetical protein
MVAFFERFNRLEAQGLLDPIDTCDIFCLCTVFLPVMQVTMDDFYAAMSKQRKRKSTRNPNYPAGG